MYLFRTNFKKKLRNLEGRRVDENCKNEVI